MGEHVDARERVWRQGAKPASQLKALSITESPVFVSTCVEFQRVTVLVGTHGAGKTYLLQMISDALPGWQVGYSLPPSQNGPDELRLAGVYTLELEGRTLSVALPSTERRSWLAGDEWTVTHLSSFKVQSELEFFAQNLMPWTDPDDGEATELKRRDLEALNMITGHQYDKVTYRIIGEDDERFPWVRASRAGRHVTSLSMSASEFWVHYILAMIRASPNTIFVIDEPESFLAGPGHKHFIDEIARLTLASNCQTILATNSDEMIRATPPQCLRLLIDTSDGTQVHPTTDRDAVLRALSRGRVGITGLIFVEDELAAAVVRAILRLHAPHRLDHCDIVSTGGHGEVRVAVRTMAKSVRLRTIGVLDGDQTDTARSGLLVLPGHNPEADILRAVTRSPEQVAHALNVTVLEVGLAADTARFTHHQDVFARMAAQLPGVSEGGIRDAAVDVWLNQPEVRGRARALAMEIDDRLP